MAADKIGKAKEFIPFKSDEDVSKPAEESVEAPLELKPEEPAGEPLEVKDTPAEEVAAEGATPAEGEVKPEDKPATPEIPEEYKQYEQFAKQYYPMVQGLSNMSPEDQKMFYAKAQGLQVPQGGQVPAPQQPQAQPTGLSEEQVKDINEFMPGLGDMVKSQSARLAQIEGQVEQNSNQFKSQADVNFESAKLEHKNRFIAQESQLTKEFPSLESEDIDAIRQIGLGLSNTEMNKGNTNYVVDLYSVGKSYAKRMNRTGKKPSIGGTNNSVVQKPKPTQNTISVNTEGDEEPRKRKSVESAIMNMLNNAEAQQ